jgi:hypothetical protein
MLCTSSLAFSSSLMLTFRIRNGYLPNGFSRGEIMTTVFYNEISSHLRAVMTGLRFRDKPYHPQEGVDVVFLDHAAQMAGFSSYEGLLTSLPTQCLKDSTTALALLLAAVNDIGTEIDA